MDQLESISSLAFNDAKIVMSVAIWKRVRKRLVGDIGPRVRLYTLIMDMSLSEECPPVLR